MQCPSASGLQEQPAYPDSVFVFGIQSAPSPPSLRVQVTDSKGHVALIVRAFSVIPASAFYVADLVRSQTSHTTGQWYFELAINAATTISKIGVGIDNNVESLTLEAGRAGAICWLGDGTVNYNGQTAAYTTSSFSVGDVLGVNPDLTVGTVRFRVNGGAWSTTFSIAAIVGGPMYALAQLAVAGDQVTANFTGSPAFSFSIPAGATAWG